MEKLYYLNHERFQKGDTQIAYLFVKKLLKTDPNIDTITFLVLQERQYEPFVIEELNGVTLKDCRAHSIPTRSGRSVQFHTVKTYSPGYLFQGNPHCEVLIAIGVPPNHLEQFVDRSRVRYWVIVPWLMEENQSFLAINEAIDLETNQSIDAQYNVDSRLKGAVKWLIDTSYPNEGYHHPNDMDRLKQMANAVDYWKVPFERESLIHHCIHNGMLYSAALKTVEAFERARQRHFPIRQQYGNDFLLKMMNQE